MTAHEPEDHARRKDPWTSHNSAKDPSGRRWVHATWILYRCFWTLAMNEPWDPNDPLGLSICRTDNEAADEAGYEGKSFDWSRRRVGTLRELGLIFVPSDRTGAIHTRINPGSKKPAQASRIGPRGVQYMQGEISWSEIYRLALKEKEQRRT